MQVKGGHKPDKPNPRPDRREMESEGGISPHEPPEPSPDAGSQRPDRPQPTRGIRYDVPPAKGE
jgi:hypothetical protein